MNDSKRTDVRVKKLQLNRETVRSLNDQELSHVVGGTVFTTANCPTGDCGCMVNTFPLITPGGGPGGNP